jgi:phage FluMu protein Com
MNCAKCSNPSRVGRQTHQFRLTQSIRLLKVGSLEDHDKFQCPKCKAIFWFLKPAIELQPA